MYYLQSSVDPYWSSNLVTKLCNNTSSKIREVTCLPLSVHLWHISDSLIWICNNVIQFSSLILNLFWKYYILKCYPLVWNFCNYFNWSMSRSLQFIFWFCYVTEQTKSLQILNIRKVKPFQHFVKLDVLSQISSYGT